MTVTESGDRVIGNGERGNVDVCGGDIYVLFCW